MTPTMLKRFLPLCLLSAGALLPLGAKPVVVDTTPDPVPEYDWGKDKEPPVTPPADVRLNTLGFTPGAKKVATVLGENRPYRILRQEDGTVVLQGKSTGLMVTKASDTGGEHLSFVDFSALEVPGKYVIEVEGGRRGATFEIGEHVWNTAFRESARAFYLWRCGTPVDAVIQGKPYHHDACHLEDGYLDKVGGPAGARKPSIGGWHDAGDYNKYVVNAGITTGLLWNAWDLFRPGVKSVKLDLPKDCGRLPELVAELKFEYDWLLTMQMEDGRVYHKLSQLNFFYWGPPDKDTAKRYFSPWSTTATADFAAMMALGARHFREFDPAYADTCLAAARRAWEALKSHPQDQPADLEGFHTGAYQVPDTTHRLWAACELWETTGEAAFLKDFETRAAQATFREQGPDWGDVADLALGTYLRSRREGRDPALTSRLSKQLHDVLSSIVTTARSNAHARPFGDDRKTFFWGSNGAVVGQTYLLYLGYKLEGNRDYLDTAADALGYLFGRNYHGRSYVTGLGFMPPEFTHDRRGTPQHPGYLVGGPVPTARHWYDTVKDPSRNEVAINWNAGLVFALSAFVKP